MTIALPPDLERFLRSEVDAGRYSSVEEAACVAIRNLKRREAAAAALRQKIAEAEAELAQGEGIVLASDADIDSFFDEEILSEEAMERL